jgi:DNA-binding NtrC family response regulator
LLRRAEATNSRAVPREITKEAIDILSNHDWPDNVRGLQNCLIAAVNTFPDNDRLVGLHLNIPKQPSPMITGTKKSFDEFPEKLKISQEPSLKKLFDALEEFSFESISPSSLAEILRQSQRIHARVLARLVQRAATLNLRYAKNPEGEVAIQPSMKLLAGRQDLSTTDAKRLAARLLSYSPKDIKDLTKDTVLQQLLAAQKKQPKKE